MYLCFYYAPSKPKLWETFQYTPAKFSVATFFFKKKMLKTGLILFSEITAMCDG